MRRGRGSSSLLFSFHFFDFLANFFCLQSKKRKSSFLSFHLFLQTPFSPLPASTPSTQGSSPRSPPPAERVDARLRGTTSACRREKDKLSSTGEFWFCFSSSRAIQEIKKRKPSRVATSDPRKALFSARENLSYHL